MTNKPHHSDVVQERDVLRALVWAMRDLGSRSRPNIGARKRRWHTMASEFMGQSRSSGGAGFGFGGWKRLVESYGYLGPANPITDDRIDDNEAAGSTRWNPNRDEVTGGADD